MDPVRAVEKLAEIGAYGINFHDDDVVPFGTDDAERDRILDGLKKALADTGLVVTTATTNLFTHPVFKDGGFTSNNRDVRRYALKKVMRNIDLAAELGAKIYVAWGGRDGAESGGAKDVMDALDRNREAYNLLGEFVTDRGYDLRFAIEPKPNEPRGDILLPTVGHAMAFISTLDRPELVGVNPEIGHEEMAGLNAAAGYAQALWQGKLFHIDLNGQHGPKYDQDLRFGAGNVRGAFWVVDTLLAGGYDGPVHFDFKTPRTEDDKGVWIAAEACMTQLPDPAREGARLPGRPRGAERARRRPAARSSPRPRWPRARPGPTSRRPRSPTSRPSAPTAWPSSVSTSWRSSTSTGCAPEPRTRARSGGHRRGAPPEHRRGPAVAARRGRAEPDRPRPPVRTGQGHGRHDRRQAADRRCRRRGHLVAPRVGAAPAHRWCSTAPGWRASASRSTSTTWPSPSSTWRGVSCPSPSTRCLPGARGWTTCSRWSATRRPSCPTPRRRAARGHRGRPRADRPRSRTGGRARPTWAGATSTSPTPCVGCCVDRVPVAVDNDANCAARAESVHGVAAGVDDFVYLTGTVGLGAGIVVRRPGAPRVSRPRRRGRPPARGRRPAPVRLRPQRLLGGDGGAACPGPGDRRRRRTRRGPRGVRRTAGRRSRPRGRACSRSRTRWAAAWPSSPRPSTRGWSCWAGRSCRSADMLVPAVEAALAEGFTGPGRRGGAEHARACTPPRWAPRSTPSTTSTPAGGPCRPEVLSRRGRRPWPPRPWPAPSPGPGTGRRRRARPRRG